MIDCVPAKRTQFFILWKRCCNLKIQLTCRVLTLLSLNPGAGYFGLKIGDQRVFYVFDNREATLYGHVFKGIITITEITRRTEDTYRP